MNVLEMHKEDIKSELRKRFGSIRQFEIEHDLPKGSVHEVLRKRRWKRVELAIESVLPPRRSTATNEPAKYEKSVNHNKVAA